MRSVLKTLLAEKDDLTTGGAYDIHKTFLACFTQNEYEAVDEFLMDIPDDACTSFTFHISLASHPAKYDLRNRNSFLDRFSHSWSKMSPGPVKDIPKEILKRELKKMVEYTKRGSHRSRHYHIHDVFDDCFTQGNFELVNDILPQIHDDALVEYTFTILVASCPAHEKLSNRNDFIDKFYHQWDGTISPHSLEGLTAKK